MAKAEIPKREAGESLDHAMHAAGIGTWDIQFGENRIVTWDARCRELFGLSKDNKMPYEQAINFIHPDDKAKVQQTLAATLNPNSGGKFDLKYRTIGGDDGILRLLHFTGKAYFDEQGNPYRFSGIVVDASDELSKRQPAISLQEALLSEAEDMFKNVTRSSPTGLWLADREGRFTYLNDTLVAWTGQAYSVLLGDGLTRAIIEVDREQAVTAFMQAVESRSHYEAEFRMRKADGSEMWCRAAGDPFYLKDGTYGGFSGFCMDITERVKILTQVKESEERLRTIIEQAPMAIGVLRGEDFIVESANDAILSVWGKDQSILSLPIVEALPEIKGQPFVSLLKKVYTTGETYYGYETLARLGPDNELKDIYIDFVYAPLKDRDSSVNGILVLATDVTGKVHAKKKLEESELFVRNVFYNSPVAKIVYTGKNMIVRDVNEGMLKIFGRDTAEGFLGMPLMEAVPEFINTPLFERYTNVLKTGVIHVENAERIKIIKYGEAYWGYYDYIYKPLRNTTNEIYGVICTAVEVTEQVVARQRLEETESRLLSAIELAGLATWNFNIKENTFSYSSRFMNWLGFSEDTKQLDDAYNPLPDDYRLSVPKAIADTIRPGSTGMYDNIHPIVNRSTGQTRIIHAQGQLFYDDNGEPEVLRGTAQDITIQQELQMELSHQVQQRTEELASAIEELQSTNEELAQSNDRLMRSNEELSQYAYIASHDLQEPLRKILVFSDMLEKQTGLSEKNMDMVVKISRSSKRMSMLIKDLLEFSRLLNSEKMTRSVDLAAIATDLVADFELIIEEKKAVININGNLPSIEAVPLQMNQLFYNLINNALKFVKEDEPPVITIAVRELKPEEVKPYIHRVQPGCRYYDISITDNGIGFDTKFSEQIFEVFKRLHGREVYPGSGIGLALCKRIVTNHGGHLYAESVPGVGSAFHILLPEKQ